MAILNVNGNISTDGNISTTGVVTTNTVAFKACLNADTTLGSGGVRMWNDANALNGHKFTSIDFNVGSAYNASNTTFTAPYSGLYYFSTWLATNASGPAQSYTSCEYYINGTRRSNGWQGKAQGYQNWTSCDIFDLSKNDAITFGGEWQTTSVEETTYGISNRFPA